MWTAACTRKPPCCTAALEQIPEVTVSLRRSVRQEQLRSHIGIRLENEILSLWLVNSRPKLNGLSRLSACHPDMTVKCSSDTRSLYWRMKLFQPWQLEHQAEGKVQHARSASASTSTGSSRNRSSRKTAPTEPVAPTTSTTPTTNNAPTPCSRGPGRTGKRFVLKNPLQTQHVC